MIWAFLIGLSLGAAAKLLMPGRDPGGIFLTMVFGVLGAISASWFGEAYNLTWPDEVPGLILAVIGSLVFLLAYRALIIRTAHHS